MNSHQIAMAASVCISDEDAVRSVDNQTQAAFENNTDAQPARSEMSFVPGAVSRTHTLILTGGLDRRSAHALEAEIERLCDDGVTGITLDLRQLTYIDAVGVAVIAFRCRLCQKRGYDFALIPGSQLMRDAFERAGVTELLPLEGAHNAVPLRPPAVARGRRLRSVAAR
jgi:anti-anti-sigma factor